MNSERPPDARIPAVDERGGLSPSSGASHHPSTGSGQAPLPQAGEGDLQRPFGRLSGRPLRIAWGVMGYGRGHAMRTMSVLPTLMREHEITVFAGGDAYEVLAPLFPTVRIPTIGYRYNASGG